MTRLPLRSVGLLIILLVVGLEKGNAVPLFARKYGKPCQTCHVSEPKLNAFGELFRANGYQLPGTIEDTPPWTLSRVAVAGMLHEMAVSRQITNNMDATPPPGLPPGKTYDVLSARDAGGHLWFGGTLGKKLSYFASLGVEQEFEVEMGRFASESHAHWEQAFFQYNNIFNSATGMANLRFGSFELELPFSDLRRLSSALAPYEVYSLRGVKGGFKLAAPQVGASFNGLKHLGVNSLRYEVAVVNGTNANFDTNVEFDYYGRLAFARLFDGLLKQVRVGGLYYMGWQNLRDLSGNPYPTVAILEYWKDTYDINVHINPENAAFNRWGVDLSLDLDILGYPINLYGQYLVGHDDDIDMTDHDLPCFSCGAEAEEGGDGHAGHKVLTAAGGDGLEGVTRPFDYSGGFAGADIVVIPTKLYFVGRYDWINVDNQWGDKVDNTWQRENIKYVYGQDDEGGDLTVVRGDDMPNMMTKAQTAYSRYTVGFRYHPLQPVTLIFEYASQDNLFGFPEPVPFMYNPDWVAGMGRVVDIDSSWFMFMVMFAF